MKALFLITWRQWLRGGARTWFTAVSALVCSAMLAAVQFGGASLAASFALESGFSEIVLAVAQAVEILLVVFLAVLLRGTFAMSLAQRTRMLGQLASVGATRRQLRRSVWLDALLLSVFAAPLGVLCAAGGLAVTFRLMQPFFDVLSSVGVNDIRLVITPQAVALALACPVVTLLLAATGAARRAARLSPVEAVRGAVETPPRRLRRHEPREAASLLASRSVRRAGGRFRTQVSIIVVCALLICLADGFARGLLQGYMSQFATYSYRVYLWVRNADTEDLFTQLESTAHSVTDDAVYTVERTGWRVWESESRAASILTLDDDAFAAWYGEELPQTDGVLACVYAPQDQSEVIFSAGDQLSEAVSGQPITVADVCAEPLPDGITQQNSYELLYSDGLLITSQSAFNALRGTAVTGEDKREFELFVDTDDAALLTPALEQTLKTFESIPHAADELGMQWQIQDFTPGSPTARYQRAVAVLLNVFVTGFEALAAVGCGASLLGSIGAETQLRRREFALLRSAGMTKRDVARMLRRETALRCAWGLGIGLPAGIALWLFMARWLLGNYTFAQNRTELCLAALLCAALIGTGAAVLCLAAERAAMHAALQTSIRNDLARE